MGFPVSAVSRTFLPAFVLAMLAGMAFALPLSVSLLSPSNGETITEPLPTFSWVATGSSSPELTCNLYIDSELAIPDMRVAAGVQHSARRAFPLSEGTHKWFVSCWDATQNNNTSELRTLVRASVSIASVAPPSPIPVFVIQSEKQPGSLASASLAEDIFSWPTVLVFPLAVLPAVFMIFLLMSKKRKSAEY